MCRPWVGQRLFNSKFSDRLNLMLFSSVAFIFYFFPVVFLVYWLVPAILRNLFLLMASLFFYAWGEWHLAGYFVIFIFSNYLWGLLIKNRKIIGHGSTLVLCLGIAFNLLSFCYFKYTVFLGHFIVDLLNIVKIPWDFPIWDQDLPLGISFFTFQAMSYLVDVYRKEVEADRSFLAFATYISFFPQLIAGPIVRYVDVVTQLKTRIVSLDDLWIGAKRFVLGLAKKVLIADVLARYVDIVFLRDPSQLGQSLAWVAIIGYAFQIYFDFSAYSDMAIGIGRMFGFHFHENFQTPYQAGTITEFWRRWHISLSTWFRDYLYIPLGGNRKGKMRTGFNLSIVFLLCGLWHGANWTFVLWGAWHGFFLLIERLLLKGKKGFSSPPFGQIYVFAVVLFSWVLFRSPSLSYAIGFSKLLLLGNNNLPTFAVGLVMDVQLIVTLILAALVTFGPWATLTAWWIDCRELACNNSLLWVTFGLEYMMVPVLFLIASIYVVAGTYHPFIYFRF
jgi:alginate O-acetyltransferase complex protein AlgI